MPTMLDTDHKDRLDLIQRLLLEAGRRMEDASSDLALNLPDDAAAIDERIAKVEEVACDLVAFARASRVLFQKDDRLD